MTYFALNNKLFFRKEYFGCICFNPNSERFYQYNKDGLTVLKLLTNPMTIDSLLEKLNKDYGALCRQELENFIIELNKNEILITLSANDLNSYLPPTFTQNEDFEGHYLTAPTGCTIYVTEFCSKKCLHCITRSGPKIEINKDFSALDWKPVFERLRRWGVISLIFTGGDPLLKKDIFEILEIADSFGFHICLLTDFDGINQIYVDRLKKITGLKYIQVSLDGASAETHDFLRGEGAFEKSIRRIELLTKNGFPITVSTVIHKLNFTETLDIARLCKKLGVRFLYINPLAPYGRAKDLLSDLVLSNEQLKELGYLYYYIIRVEGLSSGNVFWENLTEDIVFSKDFNPFKDITTVMSAGLFQLSITSKGDCYLDSKMKSENILKLGNVKEKSFEDMWHDEIILPLRKRILPGEPAFLGHHDVLQILKNKSNANEQFKPQSKTFSSGN